jgi:hypothetical protein
VDPDGQRLRFGIETNTYYYLFARFEIKLGRRGEVDMARAGA